MISSDHVSEIADFLAQLRSVKAYLSTPTRPPAEKGVQPPSEGIISQAYRILQEQIDRLECLMEEEMKEDDSLIDGTGCGGVRR